MSNDKEKNTPIQISQVSNGFEVMPGFDPTRSMDASYMTDDKHVFESLSGLTNFLKNHFTHRNENVIHD